MITQLMFQPSSLMSSGIRMSEFGKIYLFKFTDDLPRLELNKKKLICSTPKKKLNMREYRN